MTSLLFQESSTMIWDPLLQTHGLACWLDVGETHCYWSKENIIYIDESGDCKIIGVIYKKRGIRRDAMEAKVQEVFGESFKPGMRCLF